MNSNKLSTACLLLLILSTSAHFNTRVLAQQTQQATDLDNIKPSIQQAALSKLSKKVNTPIDKLEIVYTFQPTFRTIGKSGFGFVIVDKRNGKIFDIAVDANGQEMNIEKLAQQDRSAYVSKYGKLSQSLFAKLTDTKPSAQISVVIKLRLKRLEVKGIQAPTPSDKEIQQQQIENEQVVNEAINKIEELGFNVTGDNSSPAVYGNLTPSQIRAIEKLDIVDSIDYEAVNQPG
ncbi:hypothetical protein NIES4071_52690 [Calothrix sp. NIES-4071]|nr:hypothetical protein NIES4071_52690 [Calothrix sp. NIES-4071]BAZ59577.1 hypothetical protein NIES4105_52640 [Calothrix sp. NIES-4105]